MTSEKIQDLLKKPKKKTQKEITRNSDQLNFQLKLDIREFKKN